MPNCLILLETLGVNFTRYTIFKYDIVNALYHLCMLGCTASNTNLSRVAQISRVA